MKITCKLQILPVPSDETLLNEVGNQGQHQAIDMTTDKNTYTPGEVVNITIRNIGTELVKMHLWD